MARGPQFPRRKKWGEMQDAAAQELAAANYPQRIADARAVDSALRDVRSALGRRRSDYYTSEDRAEVERVADDYRRSL